IEIAPVYGGKLVSVDSAPAEAMPGVKRVVRLTEAVAVVADSYWHAQRALAALNPVFDDAGHGEVSSESIFAAFDKSLGSAPDLPAGARTSIKTGPRGPLLPPPPMGPVCLTPPRGRARTESWARR